jgi:hypothetical protein
MGKDMHKIKAVVAFALANLLSLGTAQAEIVTYSFTASITSLDELNNINGTLDSGADSLAFAGITVFNTDTVYGHLTYDTSTPAWITNDKAHYTATSYLAPGNIAFTAGQLSFNSAANPGKSQMYVRNSKDATNVDMLGFNSDPLLAPHQEEASITLVDHTRNVFHSTALPSSLDLAAFQQRSFYYTWGGQDEEKMVFITAEITSLRLMSPVPEPHSYALLLSGLLLLVAPSITSRSKT